MKIGLFADRDILETCYQEASSMVETFLINILGKDIVGGVVILYTGAKGLEKYILKNIQSFQVPEGKTLNTVIFKPWHLLSDKVEFTPEIFSNINCQVIENSDLILIISKTEEETRTKMALISKCNRYTKPYILLNVE